jgi:hypothetical protein
VLTVVSRMVRPRSSACQRHPSRGSIPDAGIAHPLVGWTFE